MAHLATLSDRACVAEQCSRPPYRSLAGMCYMRAHLDPEPGSDVGAPTDRRQERACQAFENAGQGHVFAHWATLASDAQERLLTQAEALVPRLGALTAAWRAATQPADSGPSGHTDDRAASQGALGGDSEPALAPADVVLLPEQGGDVTRLQRARERGLELLDAGRVAVFVVAGGQGTRLGFDGPKGLYPVGPVTGRTLFRLHAQQIAGWRNRTGRALPWYVMTSPATHEGTLAHFEAESYFGLPREDVRIFLQETVPAFGDDGRFFLERPDRIFENPGGHGGSLKALLDSGSLDDMDERGIDRIFYYQVDNPLVPIADPVFLGLHDLEGAEISCKVIRKEDPDEKVGIVARIDGRAGIVEYTELGDAERHLRDDRGRLVYWAGNIAIHCLDTDFVRRIAERADEWLPLHASRKKIPYIDAQGTAQSPSEPNGHKLERFVFDALPRASKVCVQEVRASEEFAPIKNAEGKDSPATARAALLERYAHWLKGTPLEEELRGRVIEIDHSRVDGYAAAQELAERSPEAIRDAIEVATGNDA